MQMQFDKARWMQDGDGTWLCLRITVGIMAKRFIETMKDRLYDLELKIHRNKRSNDANAYCWTLLRELAKHHKITPNEAYRQQIIHTPNYEIIPVRERTADRWPTIWQANGIGFIAESMGPSKKIDGYINFMCFYGSHVYDTLEMSSLIDHIVSDCKDAGIETLPPDKLDAMKGAWK